MLVENGSSTALKAPDTGPTPEDTSRLFTPPPSLPTTPAATTTSCKSPPCTGVAPTSTCAALVNELVEGESVPFLPVLRYKPSGLRKREVWERTWDLQRKQDAGEDVGDIPVPPKYTSADFLKQDYWRLRGKLDVPKERWISYPHLQTESDPSLVVGWAGWNHLQQATALVAYYDARKREGWDAKRLTPILAGLDQLLPWIHQWHPEIDPEFGDTAGQSYQAMLENDAHELGPDPATTSATGSRPRRTGRLVRPARRRHRRRTTNDLRTITGQTHGIAGTPCRE